MPQTPCPGASAQVSLEKDTFSAQQDQNQGCQGSWRLHALCELRRSGPGKPLMGTSIYPSTYPDGDPQPSSTESAHLLQAGGRSQRGWVRGPEGRASTTWGKVLCSGLPSELGLPQSSHCLSFLLTPAPEPKSLLKLSNSSLSFIPITAEVKSGWVWPQSGAWRSRGLGRVHRLLGFRVVVWQGSLLPAAHMSQMCVWPSEPPSYPMGRRRRGGQPLA